MNHLENTLQKNGKRNFYFIEIGGDLTLFGEIVFLLTPTKFYLCMACPQRLVIATCGQENQELHITINIDLFLSYTRQPHRGRHRDKAPWSGREGLRMSYSRKITSVPFRGQFLTGERFPC